NNNRRIAILEKMAEELYREWFVRLRFPGHEKTKTIKGLPEGWNISEAGRFFKLVKGKSYTSEEISDHQVNEKQKRFITLKNFLRGGGFRENAVKFYSGKFSPEQIVQGGSIIIAVTDMTQDRAVIGRVARIPDMEFPFSIISCDVAKLEPIDISSIFLYFTLRFSSFSESLKEFANGANVLHLKPELASKQKIIVPTKCLQVKFEQTVKPLQIKIDKMSYSQKCLNSIRDKLLSRLMSGKIDLESLDIQFPASMQEGE
ncbi:MAG: restriction endonuclease subunit S, partial [Erysipelotrichia bacterium]|nr:restriction endonuclease subunit S [Erysipelotrichia bacterium]